MIKQGLFNIRIALVSIRKKHEPKHGKRHVEHFIKKRKRLPITTVYFDVFKTLSFHRFLKHIYHRFREIDGMNRFDLICSQERQSTRPTRNVKNCALLGYSGHFQCPLGVATE